MSSLKMFFKSICLTFCLFVLSVSNANAASFFEEVGDWYNKITNPVSWMIDAKINPSGILATVPIDPVVKAKDRFKAERLRFHVSRDYYAAFDNLKDYGDVHNNFLLNILTFGNDESQRNLNIAYRLGNHINQYHFFVYKGKDWYYLPAHLDAGAVFMYGVNYVVNIPQRALSKIESIWDDVIPYSYVGFFSRLFLMIDVVTSSLAQFLEFIFAVVGTVIGMVIALICHPVNSLCSFVGILYFVVPILWTAGVGSLLAIFGIIGNLF